MATKIFVLTLLLHVQLSSQKGVDLTLQSEASGADVVRAVANRIKDVFGSDLQFLRRIAFVESRDGTDPNTFHSGYYGGIWQVDETQFSDTQNTASHPELSARYEQIMTAFGIDWPSVQWTDLRIPLYSGIAARLFLFSIPEPIPCDNAGQAAYWKLHYDTPAGDGTEQKFCEDLEELSTVDGIIASSLCYSLKLFFFFTAGCRVNTDIMLILDVSGSIGAENFVSVREFGTQFARGNIGPSDNQVGVITFSTAAQLQFGLDTYTDSPSLQQAIRDIPYTGGARNIPAALCKLITTFSSNTSGARLDPSVFRIAVLMTDGQSNRNDNPCNFGSVSEAAMAVHDESPTILVFAFGVGNSFDEQDVIDIASGPQFVSSSPSFSIEQLQCVQTVQEDEICNSRKIIHAFRTIERSWGRAKRWIYTSDYYPEHEPCIIYKCTKDFVASGSRILISSILKVCHL